MKTTVIFHSADMDGIFCREIARKFLPDAELIGWDFADQPLQIPDGQIYILDLPVDRVFGLTFESPAITQGEPAKIPKPELLQRIIWIDHHKSSIDSHPDIPGYRIDGVSACRLAWQWFAMSHIHGGKHLLGKESYVQRDVDEPLAVRLAGEYDIWDKRDPRAELFQHGLRTVDLNESRWWVWFFEYPHNNFVNNLCERGQALQYARTQENASVIKDIGFTFKWEGLTWLACNHARYDSHLFTAALRPEHDACFGFKFTGHCAGGKPCEQWSVSLYHAPGKEHHDLSKIAAKYGGGGHRGACGFQTNKLPFLPS